MAFVGLSDSWEEYYQAVRRCWRYGQQHAVTVHVVSADVEGAVVANLRRKEADAARLAEKMVAHMSDLSTAALHGMRRDSATYTRDIAAASDWTMHLGDCVDVARELPDASVDFSIFSPPFASLYTYSNSERDMGNCADHAEFFRHFTYLVPELWRLTKPGRLCSVHCMNLPTSKVRDGVIGLTDFRGDVIRAFQAARWIYHSEVVIWKDPVTAMQRTKALGLLHKQIKKDSAMSRQGIPDYLVTFRKPGENADPITHSAEEFPVSLWQRYASPVWMDINPSDTLQHRSVREHEDERHICPLQLEVIRRALLLWSNPDDVVFSPFAGIASEGVVALEEGRRFIGVELKRAYWEQGCANLAATKQSAHGDLFAEVSHA
ncbi:MAG: site-specific DNA-methyltransferase [Solirubrobacterales bacterium]|nr:site-specific DNA-methyltransferase [Solirubrobacterales bacterium]